MLDNVFDQDNIDMYLKELSKVFRKNNGTKTPAELILVGGASILVNYKFRKGTNDIDAIIKASSVMEEAIDITGEKLRLPNGWLNMDFKDTGSYSSKLSSVSKFYKMFSNVIEVRTIDSEYLIAMKLMSGRIYKKDLSDIAGILYEHRINNKEISLDRIKEAATYLYGSWEIIPEKSRDLINDLFRENDFEKSYNVIREKELKASIKLDEIKEKDPGDLRGKNISELIEAIMKKKEMEEVKKLLERNGK